MTHAPAAPIADHGLIGDLRSCALVARDGTIDWFCARRFDAPSVFGSLLDADAGCWTVAPVLEDSTADAEALRADMAGEQPGHTGGTQQFYLPDSAILVTRFLTPEGVVEVQDFMPVLRADDPDHRQRLVRRVVCVRGAVSVAMRLAARPDYGRARVEPRRSEHGLRLVDGDLDLALSSTADLVVDGPDVTSRLRLSAGEAALFVLEVLESGEEHHDGVLEDTDELFDQTLAYWRDWLSQSTYTGRWREMVERSALTLKLLCHEPTGAIVASPTTSLPEEIGGGRNWDYRYVWIRDAAFSVYALLRLGFTAEAASFIRWLSERMGERADDAEADDLGPLRVLYDIDGNVPTQEHELDHLAGYCDSRPVRVGNAAVEQLQLDIYGELVDSIYLYNKYGPGISHDAWQDLVRIVEWVVDNWDREDAGMWEIRDEPRRHTTSWLMCWVAVERALRVARQRGLPGDLVRWGEARDAIYDRIMTDGWHEGLEAFVQHEGGEVLDAGVLLMPMVKFLSPVDPRFTSTLSALEERLVSDSLVFRYDLSESSDGVAGEEGTFSMCSFWYVEALTRVGRTDEARLAMEKMFTYANHLGLYAEQIGLTGGQLGNFPQAFTHLSLISAATNLDRRIG